LCEKEKLRGNPGVGGGELSPDNCPVRLRHLQLGGEALRPYGLLRVILPSFVLLSEKLVNVLFGVFIDTRKGALQIRGVRRRWVVVSVQHLRMQKVRISQN